MFVNSFLMKCSLFGNSLQIHRQVFVNQLSISCKLPDNVLTIRCEVFIHELSDIQFNQHWPPSIQIVENRPAHSSCQFHSTCWPSLRLVMWRTSSMTTWSNNPWTKLVCALCTPGWLIAGNPLAKHSPWLGIGL